MMVLVPWQKTKQKNQKNSVNHCTHLHVSGSFVWKVHHVLAVYYQSTSFADEALCQRAEFVNER